VLLKKLVHPTGLEPVTFCSEVLSLDCLRLFTKVRCAFDHYWLEFMDRYKRTKYALGANVFVQRRG
jgi:hypothetical protein